MSDGLASSRDSRLGNGSLHFLWITGLSDEDDIGRDDGEAAAVDPELRWEVEQGENLLIVLTIISAAAYRP